MFKSAKLLYHDNKVYQTTKLSQIKLTKNSEYVIYLVFSKNDLVKSGWGFTLSTSLVI